MVTKKEEKQSKLEKLRHDLSFDYHSSRFFSLFFLAIYAIAITVFCLEYNIIPGPEFLVLGILFYASYNKRTLRALKDWLPFVTIFISYEIMYSVVGTISSNNLHSGPHNIDIMMFGQLPSRDSSANIQISSFGLYGSLLLLNLLFCANNLCFYSLERKPKKLLEIHRCLRCANVCCLDNFPVLSCCAALAC